MSREMVRKNISRKEAECPHCGLLPSEEFLHLLQRLRDAYGGPLHFTSIFRCTTYNRDIKGYKYSAHKVKKKNAAYGAADIRVGRYYNRRRWIIVTLAIKLGFNNIEVCDKHIHVGRVPEDHMVYHKMPWGISK